MANVVKSARGTQIDFDLLKIKNTMAAVPLNDETKKRERFISKKRRRGLKRKVDDMAQATRLENANFDSATEHMVSTNTAAETADDSQATEKTQRRKVGK